jgi:hypothetical protein
VGVSRVVYSQLMHIEQMSQDQQIAVAMMNLPPHETEEVWQSLSSEERCYYSHLYSELPPLADGTCQAILASLSW